MVRLALLLLLAGLPLFGRASIIETTATIPSACAAYFPTGGGEPSGACYTARNALATGYQSCQQNSTSTFPAYFTPSSYVAPVWTCQKYGGDYVITHQLTFVSACASTLNVGITGTLARTGAGGAGNPPPQTVCSNSCSYDLDWAEERTGLDLSTLWYGRWVGSGQSCASGPDPAVGGNTSEAARVGAATGAGETAESDFDARIAALNGGATSPLGSWFSLPSWVTGLLARPTTDCKLHIEIPSAEGKTLAFVSARLAAIDVCGVQQYADTFGNWFMWFCATLWSWVIVTGSRSE